MSENHVDKEENWGHFQWMCRLIRIECSKSESKSQRKRSRLRKDDEFELGHARKSTEISWVDGDRMNMDKDSHLHKKVQRIFKNHKWNV
jgi:hypothetical protein